MKIFIIRHTNKLLLTGLLLLFLCCNVSIGQIKSGVQVNIDGGMSQPISEFGNDNMFAGNGMNLSGGLDFYFFKGVGMGIEAGYFTNRSKSLFESFIFQRYLEGVDLSGNPSWQTKYIFGGPTLKWSLGRFEMDFTGKLGISQIGGPKVTYQKEYYGTPYSVYLFEKDGLDWTLGWNAGIRAIYKVNDWLGFQAKADYWSNSGLSNVSSRYGFKDVMDLDRNGRLDDDEFYYANMVLRQQFSKISTVNFKLGLVLQFGNIVYDSPFTPDIFNNAILSENEDLQNELDAVVEDTNQESKQPEEEKNDIDSEIDMQQIVGIPEVKETIQETIQDSSTIVVMSPQEDIKVAEETISKRLLDSLYEAGEYHFSIRDYVIASDYFGQVKDHPEHHPRARYMYAISLSFSGNCDDARKEFKRFKKEYTGSDMRSLEVLFVSQFENCTADLKNNKERAESANKSIKIAEQKKSATSLDKASNPQETTSKVVENTKESSKIVMEKEYQVQFIAIKHTGAQFIAVSKLGDIKTEYIKEKKLYRYSLTGYENLDEAKNIKQQVRAIGYQDAFIAVYENGLRKETMLH